VLDAFAASPLHNKYVHTEPGGLKLQQDHSLNNWRGTAQRIRLISLKITAPVYENIGNTGHPHPLPSP